MAKAKKDTKMSPVKQLKSLAQNLPDLLRGGGMAKADQAFPSVKDASRRFAKDVKKAGAADQKSSSKNYGRKYKG
jgi:hypothetical protein